MREQLALLVELAQLPNVTIQVLPYGSGGHAALQGPFYMLDFSEPTDRGLVYLEQAMGGLALETADEIRRYTLMFGNLVAMALSPERSITFISGMADEL